MSPTRPDQGEEIMLDYECTYCGAKKGKWCFTRSWALAPNLHSSRFDQATLDGRLPLWTGAPT